MSRKRQRWIVIPNWGKFQHYRDRNPPWIKAYTELLHDPAYVELSMHARGVLHGLWLEYAASHRRIPDSTVAITRRLGQRVTRSTLDALSDAGFIRVSASKPLAPRYPSRARVEAEAETDKEPPQTPPQTRGGKASLSLKELRRYTGCRYARGSHASTYVRDVLGTDRPPDNWPYPRPTREQVEQALNGAQP